MSKIYLAGSLESASSTQRTLAGRLITYGEIGQPAIDGEGYKVVVAKDAVSVPEDLSSVVLNVEHDKGQRIGKLMLASQHESGVDGVFHIVKSTLGNDIIAEAEMGLRNGFSIEASVDKSRILKDGTVEITAMTLTGAAVTWQPAFTGSQVYEIAASMAEPAEVEEAPEDSAPVTADAATSEKENTEVTEVTSEAVAVEASAAVVEAAALKAKKAPTLGEFLAAAKMGTLEAVVDPQVLAENPGVVPEFIVGPVIDTRLVERPIVNTARRVALPAGKTYTRPIITQHTLVGLQAAELDALVGQPLNVDSITCTKKTAGGYVPVSLQDRDWTQPAIMAYIGASMVGSMINFTEAQAAAAVVAAATATEALPADADAEEWGLAIANADAAIIAEVGAPADVLYVSPDMKARLRALVDTTKRPIFPNLGAMNAPGTVDRPWGLTLVVSQALAAGTAIVGNSQYLEFGEDADIQLTTPNAKSLGFDMALGRYFDVNVTVAGAFVSLEPAA